MELSMGGVYKVDMIAILVPDSKLDMGTSLDGTENKNPYNQNTTRAIQWPVALWDGDDSNFISFTIYPLISPQN